jgi:hypothetical protein
LQVERSRSGRQYGPSACWACIQRELNLNKLQAKTHMLRRVKKFSNVPRKEPDVPPAHSLPGVTIMPSRQMDHIVVQSVTVPPARTSLRAEAPDAADRSELGKMNMVEDSCNVSSRSLICLKSFASTYGSHIPLGTSVMSLLGLSWNRTSSRIFILRLTK